MKFIAHTLVNFAVAFGKNNEESKTPNLAHPLQHKTGKLIRWIALWKKIRFESQQHFRDNSKYRHNRVTGRWIYCLRVPLMHLNLLGGQNNVQVISCWDNTNSLHYVRATTNILSVLPLQYTISMIKNSHYKNKTMYDENSNFKNECGFYTDQ